MFISICWIPLQAHSFWDSHILTIILKWTLTCLTSTSSIIWVLIVKFVTIHVNTPKTRFKNQESPNLYILWNQWLRMYIPYHKNLVFFYNYSHNRISFQTLFHYLITSHENFHQFIQFWDSLFTRHQRTPHMIWWI